MAGPPALQSDHSDHAEIQERSNGALFSEVSVDRSGNLTGMGAAVVPTEMFRWGGLSLWCSDSGQIPSVPDQRSLEV